ncbi:hypothetical protein HAX54_039199, partial [Datura stramonium]|nr:hypothetical protein [Datura stramonium]
MASSSRNLRTEEYIHFVNDQCQFRHNEQDAPQAGFLHARRRGEGVGVLYASSRDRLG